MKKLLRIEALQIECITIKDKNSMFRAKEPDQSIISISAILPHKQIVLKEETYTSTEEAKSRYKFLVDLLQASAHV